MRFRIALPAALAGACLLAPFAARADDCATVTAAMLNGVKRPYAATITMTGMPSGLAVSHAVLTGGRMYIEVRGVWHAVPMTSQELIDQINATARKSKTSCQRTGDEAVNGEAATVFVAHTEADGHVSDNRVWISRAGLPLKTESHLAGGRVVISLFDYTHVQPPPGVH